MRGVDILGWTVLWYPAANRVNQPRVATVVFQNNNPANGIHLHVYSPDSPVVQYKGSVRHIDDPGFKDGSVNINIGGWDVLPKDRKVFENLKLQAAKAEEERKAQAARAEEEKRAQLAKASEDKKAATAGK